MRFCLPVLLLFVFSFSYAEIRLPKLVSDGMILQRGSKTKVWGWAAANEKITITFRSTTLQTKAGTDGTWMCLLPAQTAGGPYTITCTGSSNSVTIKDVLFGDVWLCSGQSNMELPMSRVKNKYATEVATANYPLIRQFEVPDTYNFEHANNDLPGGKWLPATEENILQFSAVAYFFAKDIYTKYKVPVGIINAALGGSPAKAWISEDGLKQNFPLYYEEAKKFADSNLIRQIETHDKSVSDLWYSQLSKADEGIKNSWLKSFNDDDWQTMELPGYWGNGPLGKVNGAVWFRKNILVPSSFLKKSATLILGRIVDANSVFVNGNFIGNTTYQYPPREYNIPAGLLKEGENLITVKVISNSGYGGFVPDKTYGIVSGTDTLQINGTWKYKLGATMNELPSPTFIRWKPEGLYNAMIAPLENYLIKGVLWYQGEFECRPPQ